MKVTLFKVEDHISKLAIASRMNVDRHRGRPTDGEDPACGSE